MTALFRITITIRNKDIEEGNGCVDYFERNQYLNRLLENITAEETPEIANKIPREIGKILVRKKSLEQGIVYLDWNMKFKHNLDVSRKGNYGRDEKRGMCGYYGSDREMCKRYVRRIFMK